MIAAVAVVFSATSTQSQGPAPDASATQAARSRLQAFMNQIDPAVSVKVGDKLPALTLPMAFPDGSTKAVALRDFTAGTRTLLYFYFQDNTPL